MGTRPQETVHEVLDHVLLAPMVQVVSSQFEFGSVGIVLDSDLLRTHFEGVQVQALSDELGTQYLVIGGRGVASGGQGIDLEFFADQRRRMS